MQNRTFIELFSALRRAGSSTLLREMPEQFFLTKEEKSAYDWLCAYVNEYRAFPSPRTVLDELHLQTIATKEPVEFYVEKARKRALYSLMVPFLSTMQEAMEDLQPDVAVEAARDVLRLYNNISRKDSGVVSLDTAVDELLADYADAKENKGMRGITTGCDYLDQITGGWQNSDLISVVGRPGRGKTFILLNYAYHAWRAGKSVLFVSMEMSALQLIRRFAGIHLGLNPDFVRKGMLSTYMDGRFEHDVRSMVESGIPLHIVVGNFRKSVDMIKALADELVPDIIFADASYLLQPEKKRQGNTGRRETVSDVVEELKMLAVHINRPVIQSVQFNRQAEKSFVKPNASATARPDRINPLAHLNLSQIGETDVVGQASSIVLGMEKDFSDNTETKRVIGFLKGREGETGWWKINYRFSPVDFSMIHPSDDNNGEEIDREIDLDWMA